MILIIILMLGLIFRMQMVIVREIKSLIVVLNKWGGALDTFVLHYEELLPKSKKGGKGGQNKKRHTSKK